MVCTLPIIRERTGESALDEPPGRVRGAFLGDFWETETGSKRTLDCALNDFFNGELGTGCANVGLAWTQKEMVTYTVPIDGHVPRPIDDFPPIREPRGYRHSGHLAVSIALGSSVPFPIRRFWDVDWWNAFLYGVGCDLLPPYGYRSRRAVLEYPLLHKLRLPQPRGSTQPLPPSIRSSLGSQGFQTARASTLLLRPLKRHVTVAPHPVVFGHTPIPRHVLESVVGGAGLVFPVGPAENRLVGHRNRVEVIPEWQVGHGWWWQDSSSVVTIAIREVVL